MVKKFSLIIFSSLLFIFQSCDQVDQVLKETGLTEAEVADGLKSALNVGTDTSVKILSVTDGYFRDELVKILLPAEAAAIVNNISKVPGGDILLDQAILSINRAAEDAATEATPIFKDAITGITINDAFSILNGANDAATIYLKSKTIADLTAAFKPKIGNSLSKKIVGGVSAESAYASLISAYNTASLKGLLWPEIKTNSLADHTTTKGLDGLFLKVASEELKIRTLASHRVNDILKKVFTK